MLMGSPRRSSARRFPPAIHPEIRPSSAPAMRHSWRLCFARLLTFVRSAKISHVQHHLDHLEHLRHDVFLAFLEVAECKGRLVLRSILICRFLAAVSTQCRPPGAGVMKLASDPLLRSSLHGYR
jgi:hypothetical protein